MSSYADVDCVLKVNVKCSACKGKLHEVMSSISGAFSITIDAEEGLAKIKGEMDPNILYTAISNNGKHAELKSLQIKSPNPKRVYENKVHCGSNGLLGPYGSEAIPYGYRERRVVPPMMWHETNQNYVYPNNGSSYGYNGTPHAYQYPFRHCTFHS